MFFKEPSNLKSTSTFYANIGLIENENPRSLQNDIDILCTLFERVGLKTNTRKQNS